MSLTIRDSFAMFSRTLQTFGLMLVAIGLVACAQKPVARLEDPRMYNVRAASIVGDQGVPMAIVMGVQKGIDASIASTYRSIPSPEVVLNAKLSNIETVAGPTGQVYVMHVNTALTDARNGQLVSVGEFQVASSERNERGIHVTLRDGVASQLRYAYALQSPLQQQQLPRAVPNNDFATYAPQQDQPMTQQQLTERALQSPDAILNEKSQIDTSNDPALAPGMGGTQQKATKIKPKKADDLSGLETNRVITTIPASKSSDPNAAPAAQNASATPEKPATAPAVKATSNLENGAATKIVIPAGKKPADAANTAAASATPAAPAAEPIKPLTGDEPCVVTVANDCKTTAAK